MYYQGKTLLGDLLIRHQWYGSGIAGAIGGGFTSGITAPLKGMLSGSQPLVQGLTGTATGMATLPTAIGGGAIAAAAFPAYHRCSGGNSDLQSELDNAITYTGDAQYSAGVKSISAEGVTIDFGGDSNAAGGGYVLYPNKPNTNMSQAVYAK